MSGFSAEWLALRETVDHRAISAELHAAIRGRFASCERVAIVDMGCGTGSNLRALTGDLPKRQTWRLVDHDPELLSAARETLSRWADTHEAAGDALGLMKDRARLKVRFEQRDLASNVDALFDGAPDLVTAAAFFDLVSTAWIDRFCAGLTTCRAAFCTTLTYDGVETWRPPHEVDDAILRAFNAHQRTDKGFGMAAGPGAIAAIRHALTKGGYAVGTSASPWRLAEDDRPLIKMLAAGIANAARETGLVDVRTCEDWAASRAAASSCEIGHADLWGFPKTD